MKMGKFHQIVKILFPPSILCIYGPIFFKLCVIVHIRKEWFGIETQQTKVHNKVKQLKSLYVAFGLIFTILYNRPRIS